jgi:hypothetical protein
VHGYYIEPKLEDGFIKLYRKTIESPVFQNAGLFKLWMWCLMKANHKGQWVPVKTGKGGAEIWINPGQFIFGRKSVAKELKMSPSTIRNRIYKLEKMGNITMQGATQYSLITLTSWEFYQGTSKKRTPKGHPKNKKKDTQSNEEIQISHSFQDEGLKKRPPQKQKKGHKQEVYYYKNNNIHIYSSNFLNFYDLYPRHEAKKKAWEAWQKIEKTEDMKTLLPVILDAVKMQQQVKKDAKAKGEFVPEWPYPATWLNGRRWEDEVNIKKRWDHAG